MPTQEELLQQTYSGEPPDPFEWFSKPWRKRYPYEQGIFPSMGLDFPSIPFGEALTGGESGFYPGQGQGSDGGTNALLSALIKMLPNLAQTGMKELMPSTPQNAKAVFPVDEGMAELYASPTYQQYQTIADTVPPGMGTTPGWTMPSLTGSGGNISQTNAVFPVDEGLPELSGGGLGLGNIPIGSILSTLLNQTKYGNPATNFMASSLGGLAQQAFLPTAVQTATGLFSPAAQAATTGMEALGTGATGITGFLNPIAPMMAGQQDWSNPYSGYLQGLDAFAPVLGTVLGGFYKGLTGGSPIRSVDIQDPNDASYVVGQIREYQKLLALEQAHPELDWKSLTEVAPQWKGSPTTGMPSLKATWGPPSQEIQDQLWGEYGGVIPPVASYPIVNGIDLGKEYGGLQGIGESSNYLLPESLQQLLSMAELNMPSTEPLPMNW